MEITYADKWIMIRCSDGEYKSVDRAYLDAFKNGNVTLVTDATGVKLIGIDINKNE